MDTPAFDKQLLGELWSATDLWDNLTYLCDGCNGRFAGSADERRAGDFILSRFRQYGLERVAAEPFEMRGWERGDARLVFTRGEGRVELPCLALPGGQACDLEAEVVDTGPGTAADFARLGTALAGKIVLASSDGPSRQEKYGWACDAGAAGFLYASHKPGMLAPTGSISRELPGAGLAYEHAARLRRELAAGPLRARLTIGGAVKTVTARNIVGEIPGARPEEGLILACGHYDGHDIAQGAQDNAAAAAIWMEAARQLAPYRKELKLGIRFVLFSGEELGLNGSYAYVRDHAGDLDGIRLVVNADVVGMAMPLVLRTQASPELAAYLRGLPLAELDAVVNDGPGSFIQNSDHFPFSLNGLQAVWALTSESGGHGGWVHTAGDTLDKVDPRLLRQSAATLIRLLWRMSTAPETLPRLRRSAAEVQKLMSDAGFEKNLRARGRWPF